MQNIDEYTELSVQIGDFGQLKGGDAYSVTYTEFAEKALGKIKALAENKV